MLKHFSMIATFAAAMLGYASVSGAQDRGEWYRITDGVSESHVQYHMTSVPKGKEVVLADLIGPGKITYFYVTPVSDLALQDLLGR